MLIVDGHLDLAWNALQWNRDLTRSVAELRTAPYVEVAVAAGRPPKGDIVPTVSLPQMRAGRVGVCFTTVLARATGSPLAHMDYASALQAHATGRGQLAYYDALADAGWLALVRDLASLEGVVAAWEAYDRAPAGPPPPIGAVVTMEGADPILSPGDLGAWHRLGVRAIGLSHFGSGRYAGGTGSDLGVTPEGTALLREMRTLNVILDVTHLSDPAFDAALGRWDGPVWASHTNARALVPHPRQFTDAQLKELIRRDAVVGTVCDAWMLVPGWEERGRTPPATLEHVADHLDHVCQLAGDGRHAAIGSDLDGGFGREQSPAGMDTIADLSRLGEVLRRRGYPDARIADVFHGNWLRFLRRVWG